MSEPLFSNSFLARTLRRRSFFRVVGATAAASTLVLAGCGNDNDDPTPTTSTATLTLGTGDNGMLNYAYLLEQLEAAFYQKVVDAFPADFTADDKAAFVDLRDHEVIHREFFRYALGTNAYDSKGTSITFDFSSFTLTTRSGVYAAARTLEDTGVAAYNGAAKLISDSTTLRLLAKIASVEGRHAAFVRDQAQPGSFAGSDVITGSGDAAGLDAAKTPSEVLKLIAPFVPATVDSSNLPVT